MRLYNRRSHQRGSHAENLPGKTNPTVWVTERDARCEKSPLKLLQEAAMERLRCPTGANGGGVQLLV